MSYDKNNIFAKIIRGEIPSKKIYEDDYVLAFEDINPQAPIHILVIPKSNYISYDDYVLGENPEKIALFFKKIAEIARLKNLHKTGYRLITNNGDDANQEVKHLHFHILGGRNLGSGLVK